MGTRCSPGVTEKATEGWWLHGVVNAPDATELCTLIKGNCMPYEFRVNKKNNNKGVFS